MSPIDQTDVVKFDGGFSFTWASWMLSSSLIKGVMIAQEISDKWLFSADEGIDDWWSLGSSIPTSDREEFSSL